MYTVAKKGIDMETNFEKKSSNHPQSIPNYAGHLHAENMKLYAEDAMKTSEPWKLWEVYLHKDWYPMTTHPLWETERKYRRKPRTININGFDVSTPIQIAPNYRDKVWFVKIPSIEYRYWWDDDIDRTYLTLGLVHETKEAAELHLKALSSFTQQP